MFFLRGEYLEQLFSLYYIKEIMSSLEGGGLEGWEERVWRGGADVNYVIVEGRGKALWEGRGKSYLMEGGWRGGASLILQLWREGGAEDWRGGAAGGEGRGVIDDHSID